MESGDSGPCEYCGRKGRRRAGPEDGLPGAAYACEACWSLLGSPATALPLLRGHLSLEMRGVVRPARASTMIESFMEKIREWGPRQKRS